MAKKPKSLAHLFECSDSEILRVNATSLIRGDLPRNPESLSARLAKQFIDQNWGILRNFDVQVTRDFDGENTYILIRSGMKIGAFPLISPTSGKPDMGMIIRPRFDWGGIGSMLLQMGWRVVPTLLKLPRLQGTEKKIPPWVLSSYVLIRFQALLDQLDRRFELIQTIQTAPKGTVDWARYATKHISTAQFLQIPCQFPDLRDDRLLKSAIHFSLRKQLASLESQRAMAGAVLGLIELCQSLIKRVVHIPAQQPTKTMLMNWLVAPLRSEVFREGIQSMEWVIDDRGLAGISEIQGLPWILSMEEFFEAWVETLVAKLAVQIGGIVRVGRKRETITPIQWDTPYLGTQKYLLPDVILERENETIIFDAKYKRHWEEMASENWYQVEKEIQDQHRQDLLQILAYASIHSSRRIITCLVYPCQSKTWNSLKERGLLYRHAAIPVMGRDLEIILTAVPMTGNLSEVVDHLRIPLTAESYSL